jgi:hypothetical protein
MRAQRLVADALVWLRFHATRLAQPVLRLYKVWGRKSANTA